MTKCYDIDPAPIVVVVRDPDASNVRHTFGGEVESYDIDLGYMAVYDDPEEFVQWASGHALDILKLRRRGRNDAADFIEGIVQQVMESHDRDQPRLSARPLIRSFEPRSKGIRTPKPSDP